MDDFGLPTPPAPPAPAPAPQPIPETPVITPPKKKFPVKVVAGALMALLLIGGGWFGFQEMQKRQIVEKRAGSCAPGCGAGMMCDGGGGCVPRGTTQKQIDDKSVDPIPHKESLQQNPWNDNGDGTYKPSDASDLSVRCGSGFRCAGDGWEFCIPSTSSEGCRDVALANGYTVLLGNGSDGSTTYGSGTWFCPKGTIQPGQSCDPNTYKGAISRPDLGATSCFCGTVQIDSGSTFTSYQSECGCEGKDQGGAAAEVLSSPSPSPGTSPSPSPSPSPSISCTDLTSNKVAPAMGDTVNFTCKANFSAAAPVAIFRHNVNGGSFVESATLPLNAAGEAGLSLAIDKNGDWLVQCRVCTDSTATTCTAWGLAQ